MELVEALNMDLEQKQVISLVGAGGKTSTLFGLADELTKAHKRVLITTTTAIFYPQRDQYDYMIVSKDLEEITHRLRNARPSQRVVIGTKIVDDIKLKGIPKEWVDVLFQMELFDVILVEADGSNRKPIKAPDVHEPVIPQTTTKLLGVIGFDAYGKEVSQEFVHRPKLFSDVVKGEMGGVIDQHMIIGLVTSPRGLFKNAPAHCEKTLILNKVKDVDMPKAEAMGQKILRGNPTMGGILIGHIQEGRTIKKIIVDEPIEGRKMITAIILASGFSKRFGGKKLLMEIHHKPMIRWVVDLVCGMGFGEVLVVYQDEAVRRMVDHQGLQFIYNDQAAEGMAASVRYGVEASSNRDGYMFFTGDQPFIDGDTVKLLIKSFYDKKGSIIVPTYDGQRGNPVLFSSKWKESLLTVHGDMGGREIIKNNMEEVCFVDIPNKRAGVDVDTWEDYQRMISMEGK